MWSDIIIFTPMYVTIFWAVVLLITSRQKNRAKHFLGIFMFTAFLLYLAHAVFFKKQFEVFFVFDSVYIFASLSVYPMYYLYIRLLTVESKLNIRKNLWMFIPSFVFAVLTFTIYLFMSDADRQTYIQQYLLHNGETKDLNSIVRIQGWIFYSTRVIFALQVIVVLMHGSRLVNRYNERIANFYSDLESRSILWVNLLLFSFVFTSIMSIAFNIIGKVMFYNHVILLVFPSLIFSVLLFIIGLQGYMQNHTVADLELDEQITYASATKKYQNYTLKENLLHLLDQDEIYKQPDLKITTLSTLLQTNRTYISNLINSEFSCTFSDLINRYRINEAKKLLSDQSTKNYSLNYISEQSGFGSMGTFMRVFRDFEGMTPGKYREKKELNKLT